jgi:DNA-binding NarL/FixJ family response regulator
MKRAAIGVFVIDDQEIVRTAFARVFGRDPRIRLVGAATGFEQAMEKVPKARPDVVITEVLLPGFDGLDLVRWLDKLSPRPTTIVVSAVGHPAMVLKARKAGADGFIEKVVPVEDMLDIVVRTHETGDFVWDELISIDRVFPREDAERLRTLTPREREVLIGIGQGKINREIAAEFDLTEKTVKNYVSHLLQKLNMTCRAEAAALAGRLDFAEHPPVPPSEWDAEPDRALGDLVDH